LYVFGLPLLRHSTPRPMGYYCAAPPPAYKCLRRPLSAVLPGSLGAVWTSPARSKPPQVGSPPSRAHPRFCFPRDVSHSFREIVPPFVIARIFSVLVPSASTAGPLSCRPRWRWWSPDVTAPPQGPLFESFALGASRKRSYFTLGSADLFVAYRSLIPGPPVFFDFESSFSVCML